MTKQPLILALSSVDDPQLKMLEGLPHIVVKSADQIPEEAKHAEVILHWFGPRALLENAFKVCTQVRWVHSRSAGLDSILFPALVESPIPVTNGSGVFSKSLG